MPEKPYPPGVPALFEVVRRLRAPDGCPWDREQTHESLRQYLLEETYELLEAIDAGDDEKMLEELGDVLLQVAMHAQIAEQEGRFDIGKVSEAAAAKMVARHPHVFGETQVADAEEVLRNWEHQKAAEATASGREQESVLDRVVRAMPALAWALALQKRAARVGFDFDSRSATTEAVAEEARELAAQSDPERAFEELGDLLFALVSLARKKRINPEDALRAAGQRFARRFKWMERALRESGAGFRDLDAAELQRLWAKSNSPIHNSRKPLL
jgi:tetrapyrrole methylase family protein / MazG family protein